MLTSDNLNTTRVNGSVVREFEEMQGNQSVLVNETVGSFDFERVSPGVEEWTYSFSDTDTIGQYYLRVDAFDESNNSASFTESFKVEGLESVNVLESNFVFDTIRPKGETGIDLVNNSVGGTEFSVSLGDLSYDGNESVRVGLVPPSGESPEFFEINESKSFSEAGVYEVVLVHSGNDELKGTHRVTGELSVSKPGNHVRPRSVEVSFSGTVKNLDKPPETCERIAEFDSCIAYSLDQSRSLFDERFGIQGGNKTDYAYLIGRIPTSDVEGSDEWGDASSLTFGQYNKTEEEKERLQNRVESLESTNGLLWNLLIFVPLTLIGVGGGLGYWYYSIGQYVSIARSREKFLEKVDVMNPEEGLN